MQVFISHKSQDKKEAIFIKEYLERCFIKTWLDKDDLKGGDALSGKFLRGIKGNTTIAFIGESYASSDWCRNEFTTAYAEKIRGRGDLIAVLIGDVSKIKSSVKSAKFDELETMLEDYKYLEYDIYHREKSCAEIAKTVQKDNPIRFRPIENIIVQGKTLQFIDFSTDTNIPLEVFQTWDCNFDNFMDHNNEGNKPIKKDIPVAIFGKGPCWLYAHLSIPFCNKNEVYIYNEPSGKYFCIYARATNKNLLGEILSVR